MLQVNEIFKNAVEQDSRTFKARVVLGKDIFEGIKSFALHAASNNSAHISIGGAVAASVQVKMEATTISLESKEITLQIGVLFGTEYIYCDLGKFTPEKVNNDDGIINFCAYDRMYVKFSKAYVSKLEYPADGKEVLKEISNMSGVPLASSIDNLPSGVKIPKRWKETETTYDDEGNEITQGNYVNPFDGYTMQDALGYVAQFYGKYCVINRNGEIELRWYKQADYEISASRYYDDLKKSESLFKLGRIQCDTATATLLSGVGTVGIQIENPVMTQPVLDKICNQLKDFTFQPASVSFLGDPRLDIGDIVTIHDKYGGKIKIPIMKLSMDYDGGLITEIESQGKTEIESGSISSSKGPTAQAIERLNIELVAAKEIICNVRIKGADDFVPMTTQNGKQHAKWLYDNGYIDTEYESLFNEFGSDIREYSDNGTKYVTTAMANGTNARSCVLLTSEDCIDWTALGILDTQTASGIRLNVMEAGAFRFGAQFYLIGRNNVNIAIDSKDVPYFWKIEDSNLYKSTKPVCLAGDVDCSGAKPSVIRLMSRNNLFLLANISAYDKNEFSLVSGIARVAIEFYKLNFDKDTMKAKRILRVSMREGIHTPCLYEYEGNVYMSYTSQKRLLHFMDGDIRFCKLDEELFH